MNDTLLIIKAETEANGLTKPDEGAPLIWADQWTVPGPRRKPLMKNVIGRGAHNRINTRHIQQTESFSSRRGTRTGTTE